MNEISLVAIVIGTVCLFDKVYDKLKSIPTYFFWFCIILGTLYTAKVACYEYEPEELPCWRQTEVKFIPPKVPHNHVTDEGLPSSYAIDLIKRTNQKAAYAGLHHHAEKAGQHQDKLHDMCWYLPKISDTDKAKLAFTSAFAGAATLSCNAVAIVAVFIAVAHQYGLNVIQEWNDMVYEANMYKWHAAVAQAYANHINENRW